MSAEMVAITVLLMLNVQTMWVVTHADVELVSLEMDSHVLHSSNPLNVPLDLNPGAACV